MCCLDEIKNELVDDKMIAIKKLVIEQLTKSKDLNMEYKLCLDYLNNCKEPKYKEMMTNRTKKSPVELHKYASKLVADVNHWIYEMLVSLTEHQRSDLLNNEQKMNAFLESTHDYIRRYSDGNPILAAKRD